MTHVKEIKMIRFKSNYKYTVTIFLGLLFLLFCIGATIFELKFGESFPYLWILFASMISYFIIFIIPREISLDKDSLIYKTVATSQKIRFSQIKSIKPYFSTKSMQWYGGDKDKAHMLCIITLKGRQFTFLFFGNGLENYKDLFSKIKNSLEEQSNST